MKDKLVERCERVAQDAADKWLHSKPNERGEHPLADAISRATIPIVQAEQRERIEAAGMAIVPVEATARMMVAGQIALSGSGVDNASTEDADDCYTAMIAAAKDQTA